MKKKLSLFLLLSLLVCLMIPSHADTFDEADEPCSHGTFLRASATQSRCVADGDAVHVNETYFTACCANCGEHQVEILETSKMEPHNYEQTSDECHATWDASQNYHVYVFTCKDCGHEVIMLQPCAGYHPDDIE